MKLIVSLLSAMFILALTACPAADSSSSDGSPSSSTTGEVVVTVVAHDTNNRVCYMSRNELRTDLYITTNMTPKYAFQDQNSNIFTCGYNDWNQGYYTSNTFKTFA